MWSNDGISDGPILYFDLIPHDPTVMFKKRTRPAGVRDKDKETPKIAEDAVDQPDALAEAEQEDEG